MPLRKYPIITGEIYHVYNRSIASQPIFRNINDYSRMIETIDFYRFYKPPLRFSFYNRLVPQEKADFLKNLYKNYPEQIEIFSFSLMPNHYHFLLKQKIDNGITEMIKLIQESYAKYLNTKIKRDGSVFQAKFKAVRIETDEQFLHVSRYVHLNPLTNYVLRYPDEIKTYPWTSFVDYISMASRPFINTKPFNSFFKSRKKLIEFTLDQLDYQRKLETIKHLIHE